MVSFLFMPPYSSALGWFHLLCLTRGDRICPITRTLRRSVELAGSAALCICASSVDFASYAAVRLICLVQWLPLPCGRCRTSPGRSNVCPSFLPPWQSFALHQVASLPILCFASGCFLARPFPLHQVEPLRCFLAAHSVLLLLCGQGAVDIIVC
jgi:hypothetical protein